MVRTGSMPHSLNTRDRVNGGRASDASSWGSANTRPDQAARAPTREPGGCEKPDPETQGVGVPFLRACGHNVRVATTAPVIPASRLHGHSDRPSMVSVGT